MRELLAEFGFDSEETPVIIGSALCALEVGAAIICIEFDGNCFKVFQTLQKNKRNHSINVTCCE